MGAIGSRLADFGIDDKFTKSLSNEMMQGELRHLYACAKGQTDRVEPEWAKFGGKILRTSLSKDAEASCRLC